MDKLNNKEISFEKIDFRRLDIDEIRKFILLLYFDSYYLGDASYYENGDWTETNEKELLEFLELFDEK